MSLILILFINTDYYTSEYVSYLLIFEASIEIFINWISFVMFSSFKKLKLSNFSEVISNYSITKFKLL